MQRTNARRHGAAVALAAMALIVAACGDSDSGDETAGPAQTDTTSTTAPSTTAPETTAAETTSTSAGGATDTEDTEDTDDTRGGDEARGTGDAEGAGGDVATGEHVGPVVELTVGEEATRHSVSVGDEVMVIVTGDVTDEIHVHGYDLVADLVPGQPATMTFTADIPGVFEIELHDAGTLLAELEVQ